MLLGSLRKTLNFITITEKITFGISQDALKTHTEIKPEGQCKCSYISLFPDTSQLQPVVTRSQLENKLSDMKLLLKPLLHRLIFTGQEIPAIRKTFPFYHQCLFLVGFLHNGPASTFSPANSFHPELKLELETNMQSWISILHQHTGFTSTFLFGIWWSSSSQDTSLVSLSFNLMKHAKTRD